MVRLRMLQGVKLAALAAALCFAMGSLAWGDDDYRHHEAREQGYRNGYQDGARAGQYDRERGYRFRFKNDQWEDAPGYEHRMGSPGQYKSAYRHGYEDGYRRSFASFAYRRGGDRDRDDRWRGDDWR